MSYAEPGLPILNADQINELVETAGGRAISFLTSNNASTFCANYIHCTYVTYDDGSYKSQALASYWREKCQAWLDNEAYIIRSKRDLAEYEADYAKLTSSKKKPSKRRLDEICFYLRIRNQDVAIGGRKRAELLAMHFKGFHARFSLEVAA